MAEIIRGLAKVATKTIEVVKIAEARKKFARMNDDEVKMYLCDQLREGGVFHPCLGLQCDRCPLNDLEDI